MVEPVLGVGRPADGYLTGAVERRSPLRLALGPGEPGRYSGDV